MEVGANVWVRDREGEEAWVIGTVLEKSEGKPCKVQIEVDEEFSEEPLTFTFSEDDGEFVRRTCYEKADKEIKGVGCGSLSRRTVLPPPTPASCFRGRHPLCSVCSVGKPLVFGGGARQARSTHVIGHLKNQKGMPVDGATLSCGRIVVGLDGLRAVVGERERESAKRAVACSECPVAQLAPAGTIGWSFAPRWQRVRDCWQHYRVEVCRCVLPGVSQESRFLRRGRLPPR